MLSKNLVKRVACAMCITGIVGMGGTKALALELEKNNSKVGVVCGMNDKKCIDEVYKKAYDTLMSARKSNSQKDINTCRQAIKHLHNIKGFEGFAGEFSRQLDLIQQGLFDKYLGLVMESKGKLKKELSQKLINDAREIVIELASFEGNLQYVSTWSQVLDVFQQPYVDKAVKSVENAEKSKKNEDVKTAKGNVTELKTVKNNASVEKIASDLDKRMVELEKALATKPTEPEVKPTEPEKPVVDEKEVQRKLEAFIKELEEKAKKLPEGVEHVEFALPSMGRKLTKDELDKIMTASRKPNGGTITTDEEGYKHYNHSVKYLGDKNYKYEYASNAVAGGAYQSFVVDISEYLLGVMPYELSIKDMGNPAESKYVRYYSKDNKCILEVVRTVDQFVLERWNYDKCEKFDAPKIKQEDMLKMLDSKDLLGDGFFQHIEMSK